MRWSSLCAVLGATLVNARPLCRPDRSTTAVTTTETSVPIQTSTVAETSFATTTQASTTEETSILTETETETPTETFTTLTATTLDETMTAAPTTGATTSTTTDAATTTQEEDIIITNFARAGNFEDPDENSVWEQRTCVIAKDASKAASGSYFARYTIVNEKVYGGNNLNQTLDGLDTGRLYRLSFSGAVFGAYHFGGASCKIKALVNGEVRKSWPISNFVVDQYKTYSTDLEFSSDYNVLSLKLECSTQNAVTIDFGIDDVSLVEVEDEDKPKYLPVPH
ncbi:hypothetical protein FSARC_439 [Fusarium sarcochroum]|uniref:CBM-cenC domain-containing protein n=1 Tax=Fusarium sarcochroum TaxID=1208366 RepID=A0A8H4XFE5_9HYPO|nr:hypothetical protein FSARC_439 [Fusarium sarcochroum]